jgi:hypothetical protein
MGNTKKENMRKISGDEGCHGKNAVLRHGVFAMTGSRILVFAYTPSHEFVVASVTDLFDKTVKLR